MRKCFLCKVEEHESRSLKTWEDVETRFLKWRNGSEKFMGKRYFDEFWEMICRQKASSECRIKILRSGAELDGHINCPYVEPSVDGRALFPEATEDEPIFE